MNETFDASTRDRRLEVLFAQRDPQRIKIHVDGVCRAFGDPVHLRISEGRLLDARVGRREGAAALTVLALAEAGRIEASPDAHAAARVGASLKSAWADARNDAVRIEEITAPLGGLGAVPMATGRTPAGAPDPVREILALVDGRRTYAGVLAASDLAPLMAARIVGRLAEVEAIRTSAPAVASAGPRTDPALPPPVAAEWRPPASSWGESSVLPSEDEVEGEAATAEVHAWLQAAPEEPLASGEAFRSVFVEGEAGRRPPPPVVPPIGPATPLDPFGRPMPERAPPAQPPAPASPAALAADDDDLPDPDQDEAMREAGVGASRSPALLVGLLAAAGIGLALVMLASGDREPVVSPPVTRLDAALAAAASTVAATATRADAPALVVEGRPPIAGPDAPAEVKEAEALLDAGRYAEADAMLVDLRSQRPEDPVVFVLSGQLYVDTGKLGPALEMAEEAINRDPKFYRAWVLKGSALQFRGQKQAAVAAYERALSLEPAHLMSPEIRSVADGLRAQ